jgi:hypothetical protein
MKEVSGVMPLKKARSTSGNLDGIEPATTPNSSFFRFGTSHNRLTAS